MSKKSKRNVVIIDEVPHPIDKKSERSKRFQNSKSNARGRRQKNRSDRELTKSERALHAQQIANARSKRGIYTPNIA